MRYLVALVVVAAGVSGCGTSAVSTVRARGSEDLRCDRARVQVTAPSNDTVFDTPFPYYASGCGGIARYMVSYCSGAVGCTITDAQIVSTMVRRQAAFDLRCEERHIDLHLLNRDVIGAEGCGQRTTYSLVDCEPPSTTVGGVCRVVSDGAR